MEFIDGVNTVLQQLRGKVVEELEVKFEFESILIDHLNNWISFAVSSLVKNLVLDLAPAEFVVVKNGYSVKNSYMFPTELFDGALVHPYHGCNILSLAAYPSDHVPCLGVSQT